ncbi:MAG: hypothetical protein SGPRY_006545 [Prymnesium sp.]
MLVAVLVFALLFFEFGLVQLTSSLSLSVFGIFKELVTILLAAATLGDVLSLDLFLADTASPLVLHVAGEMSMRARDEFKTEEGESDNDGAQSGPESSDSRPPAKDAGLAKPCWLLSGSCGLPSITPPSEVVGSSACEGVKEYVSDGRCDVHS